MQLKLVQKPPAILFEKSFGVSSIRQNSTWHRCLKEILLYTKAAPFRQKQISVASPQKAISARLIVNPEWPMLCASMRTTHGQPYAVSEFVEHSCAQARQMTNEYNRIGPQLIQELRPVRRQTHGWPQKNGIELPSQRTFNSRNDSIKVPV